MEHFQRYDIKKVNHYTNEYMMIIYLDDQLTEFASELDQSPTTKKNMMTNVRQILNNRYPNLKITMVKVVIGGMAMMSIPIGGTIAEAAETTSESSPQQVVQADSIYYQVKPADTLWSLARTFNTTVDQIKQANNLNSDTVRLNQQLIIPQAFHTVQSGDYLTVLAKKYNTSVDAIKEANRLTSDFTKIGQTLVIPVSINQATPQTSQTTEKPSDQQGSASYTVVSGDNLSTIAKRFGTTVDAIKSANNLTSDFLRVGQDLTIPTAEITDNTPVQQTTESYTVVSGDNLTTIAKRFGTTVDAIKSANNLTSDFLRLGQELTIPTAKTTDATTETAPTQQTTESYTVVSGDNLTTIAKRFGTTVDAIKSANNLTSDFLRLGQELTIPTAKTTDATTETAPTQQTTESYTVVSGDNLTTLAKRFGTTVDAIKSANNLTSDFLRIGQTLNIPSQNAPSHPVQQTTPEQIEQERVTFTYSVRSGDNLSALANRFDVSVDAIRTANQLKSDMLQVGQALTIPNGINAPVQAGTNTVTYTTHTVKAGDTIWDISVRYGIPQQELLRTNNLTASSMLSIGQKLTIPVHQIGVKQVVSEKHGEYLDWWTEAQYVFTIGKTAKVTDFVTGKSFYIKRTIGANHADSETVSINDTNIAKSIWGGYSWTPRAVILEVDGRKIAASMSFMPHEREYISGNGITGHFDVYFGDSTRHKDGKADASHQAQVEKAAGIGAV
ncbi:muramidase family protein [Aquibacillus sediminis]|uniref:muramidase family protein n=1 Tax=Aquibacillus sediminis TaxID=2574734 RepID=UPI001107E1AE|nr:LysM peptidoglycan-binding domain-containing protein [Aquibacillus sediminis]